MVEFADSVLLQCPTPDFSMPYNVITMTCTVLALFFGRSVFPSVNTCLRPFPACTLLHMHSVRAWRPCPPQRRRGPTDMHGNNNSIFNLVTRNLRPMGKELHAHCSARRFFGLLPARLPPP